MVSVKLFASSAAIGLLSTAALAADLPPPQMYQPPPQFAYQPAPVVSSGWYLRGDVGVGLQRFDDVVHTATNSAFVWPADWEIIEKDVQDTTIFGGGVGYQWNNWFRTDVTGEFRTKATVASTGKFSINCAGGGVCISDTGGQYSSSAFMANAYVDLGTWSCITPYIGAGAGAAYNFMSNVEDHEINSDGTAGYGDTSNNLATWSFAWNAQAGATYNVTNNFKIDFGVRYLHLGSPQTDEVDCYNAPQCPLTHYNFTNMHSWDFRMGFRWLLQPDAPMMAPPLMSRG
jgi:opacity protein-like surface antigen